MGLLNSTCPTLAGAEDYNVHGTAWKFMLYTAGLCMCITIGIALSLITLHIQRYRAPKEQRQIIRIVFSVILYALIAFFEVYSYKAAQYIDPIGDLYEAFGLCALFLLFIQYAAPDGSFDDDEFKAVRAAEETAKTYDWPRIFWISVFQYPLFEFGCVVLIETTEATGTYCANSLGPQFFHLWYEIIASISISVCVLAVVGFRNNMKRRFKVRRCLSKLICFKAIVFIRFTQAWAFSALLSYGFITTGENFQYNDLVWGVPGLATCVEMVIFSLGFFYCFSSTEYGSADKPDEEPMLWWKAVFDVLNIWDLLAGIARIFPLSTEAHRTGNWRRWRGAQRENARVAARMVTMNKHRHQKRGSKGNRPTMELHGSTVAIVGPSGLHRTPSQTKVPYSSAESIAMTDMSGGPRISRPSSRPSPHYDGGSVPTDVVAVGSVSSRGRQDGRYDLEAPLPVEGSPAGIAREHEMV